MQHVALSNIHSKNLYNYVLYEHFLILNYIFGPSKTVFMSVRRILMTCSTFIILGFSLSFIFIARWAQLSCALPDCSKVSLPGLYDLSEALAIKSFAHVVINTTNA
jgi:hypothetical protein